MLEKHFQTKFNKWVKKFWDKGTAVFELKLARGQCLPYKDVKEHQVHALELAYNNKRGLVYKIPDDALAHKPFDSLFIRYVDAYVVIMFIHPSEKVGQAYKKFYMIPISKWVFLMEKSDRKSITINEARLYGIEGIL